VRNLGRGKEVRTTIGKIAANAGAIEFAAADLNSDAGWANAGRRGGLGPPCRVSVPAVDPKTDDELVRRRGTEPCILKARGAGK
jgi:hypothetical protein